MKLKEPSKNKSKEILHKKCKKCKKKFITHIDFELNYCSINCYLKS